MRKNNKGFVITEVLVLSTVIIGLLIFMYSQFKNINRSYQYSFKYDTVEGLYLANNIINYINEDNYDMLVEQLLQSEKGYIDITTCDINQFNTSSYCQKLFEKSKIEKIIFTEENLKKIKENQNDFDEEFNSYINQLQTLDSQNDYRIVIEYQNGTFSTMRFNKGDQYIETNLIVHLDAINNTGYGHSTDSTIWKDISNHGNDATLHNNPTWNEKSITFDGIDDYAIIENTENQEFPNGLTIETRVNILSINGFNDVNYVMFIDNTEQNITHGGFSQYISKTTFKNATRISDGLFHVLVSTTPSELNKPYTLTTVYDNNNIKLYVNGMISANLRLTSAYSKSPNPINLAKRALNTTDYANVEFESIRIYDRPLTETEILRNYQVDNMKY